MNGLARAVKLDGVSMVHVVIMKRVLLSGYLSFSHISNMLARPVKYAWLSCLLSGPLTIACTAPAPTPPQHAATNLGGTSWQLVRFQGGDDTRLIPDYRAKYTIAFGTDGSVTARIDCNRGRGTWKSSGPKLLQFGPLALTRAICRPGSIHDRIVKD